MIRLLLIVGMLGLAGAAGAADPGPSGNAVPAAGSADPGPSADAVPACDDECMHEGAAKPATDSVPPAPAEPSCADLNDMTGIVPDYPRVATAKERADLLNYWSTYDSCLPYWDQKCRSEAAPAVVADVCDIAANTHRAWSGNLYSLATGQETYAQFDDNRIYIRDSQAKQLDASVEALKQLANAQQQQQQEQRRQQQMTFCVDGGLGLLLCESQ